jgi:hypothetical protein
LPNGLGRHGTARGTRHRREEGGFRLGAPVGQEVRLHCGPPAESPYVFGIEIAMVTRVGVENDPVELPFVNDTQFESIEAPASEM